jgi:aryl-alcohol dehydrogenase-like predicted oxidoreductase
VQYRTLGRTGLRVSLLGLGSGGASRLGQAYDASVQDITRLVRRALDQGVNFIDTAPSYARSESVLGKALQGVARDNYIVCSKFQPHARDGSLRPAHQLRQSLESSLEALRTDCIDVLYLHGIAPAVYTAVRDQYLSELQAARDAGKIRWIGITERYQTDHAHAALCQAIDDGQFDVVMVGLNLTSPAAVLSVLPAAQAANVGVVVMCAVRSVLVKPELVRQYLETWERDGLLRPGAVPHDAPLDWLLDDDTPTVTDAAYKFAAAHPGVGSVLTGTGNLEHFEANLRAIDAPPLPAEKVQRVLDVFGPVQRNVQPDGH